MSYYHCTTNVLYQEVQRRGYIPSGSREDLSEWLLRDEEERGSDATTCWHAAPGGNEAGGFQGTRRTGYGDVVDSNVLVGEEIVHWTMNTFFPTIQLFFASGRSCTIATGQHLSPNIGLDPKLRFRLTDLPHEEDGKMSSSILPGTVWKPRPSIKITAAGLQQRVSVRVRPVESDNGVGSAGGLTPCETVGQIHTVVTLKLDGMDGEASIWARTEPTGAKEEALWSNVWVAGLRNDLPPPPHVPRDPMTATQQIVEKGSMIRVRGLPGIEM